MTLPEIEKKYKEKRNDDSPEPIPAKKIKLDENLIKTSSRQNINLLDLSDDVLLLICCYLNPIDLLSISQCCTRLEEVVSDRTLWTVVDFRPVPLLETDLKKYLKFFVPSTKLIATHGFKSSVDFSCDTIAREIPSVSMLSFIINESDVEKPKISLTPEITSLTADFVQSLSETAPNLKEFIAENHFIDGSKLLLEHFPSTLEHLSFKNSEVFGVPRCKSYFSGFDNILPNLECLDLTHCFWFTCHSFLALSKSKTLKKLVLYGCPQVDDCVPYVSLGFRFGFSALTILDLRQTMISDRELACFNSNLSLKELYLQAPDNDTGKFKVTDMGITMFGNITDLVENRANIANMVVLLMIGRINHLSGAPSPLCKLIVRDYVRVTDTSLKHAAVCLPNLVYIDIRGTGCTQDGVAAFKLKKPEVAILSDFGSTCKL